MPDASGDVRSAAEAVKRALDAHLAAVEQRSGEQDPTVEEAYTSLRDAAEAYDDLLFEVYDEVTPFTFAQGPASDSDEEPQTITVVARRDYDVVDREALLATARAVFAAEPEAAEVVDGVDDVASAVAVLFDNYELEGFDAHSAEAGLAPAGQTSWVLPGVPGDDWVDAPFERIDEAEVIYRLDVEPADFDDVDSDGR